MKVSNFFAVEHHLLLWDFFYKLRSSPLNILSSNVCKKLHSMHYSITDCFISWTKLPVKGVPSLSSYYWPQNMWNLTFDILRFVISSDNIIILEIIQVLRGHTCTILLYDEILTLYTILCKQNFLGNKIWFIIRSICQKFITFFMDWLTIF